MSKSKIESLNNLHSLVKDEELKLRSEAVIISSVYADPITTFTVDNVIGFLAGQEVFIDDGTEDSDFHTIVSVNTTTKKLVFTGDLTIILDGGKIAYTERSGYFEEALKIYSRVFPLKKIHTLTGDGTSLYSLPADWSNEFSIIKECEYPVGNFPKSVINKDMYEVAQQPDNTYKLKFAYVIPIAATVYITYTTIHTYEALTPYNLTSPDADFHALCRIAAGLYCTALANTYGQSADSNINADRIDYGNKYKVYMELASDHFKNAASQLGVSTDVLLEGKFKGKGGSVSQGTNYYKQRLTIFDYNN